MTNTSSPASRTRQRLFEAILVAVSLLIGYLLVEIGYRCYLFYTYAVRADYAVTTIDVRMRPTGFGAPGSIMGVYTPSTVFTLTQYDIDDRILQRHRVHTNNFGWVSHYDFARDKPQGEFRIAVIGDSLTASINNEIPWPDVLQRRLNADTGLLAALGADRITVLNLGVAGASMQMMANPLAVIARRFSPDLLVTNFVIEDLARRHGSNFEIIPDEPATPPDDDTAPAPAPPPDLVIDGVEITLYCLSGEHILANPDCRVSPLWYVPPGREIAGAELGAIRQAVARQLLLHRVLLSLRPLALLELLGRPVFPRAQAAEPALTMHSGNEDEDVTLGLRALRVIRRLHPNLLVTYNALYWHLTRTNRPAVLERFLALAAAEGFDIVSMENVLPVQGGEREWYRWYNLPHDGHWSDYGAEVYAEAMYRVIRSRLLAARDIAPSAGGAACALAFERFNAGRAALAAGDPEAALTDFTAAGAALPDMAMDLFARGTRSYRDCGFLFDLYAARAELRHARGDRAGVIADLGDAIRLRPDDPALRQARGAGLLAAGDPAAALADFTAALALRPGDLVLLFQCGQARMLTGDYAGVITDMDAALALAPGTAGYLFLRAGAETSLERLEPALADYTAAIAAMPGQAAFHQARAAVLDRLGRSEEAEADRATAAGLL